MEGCEKRFCFGNCKRRERTNAEVTTNLVAYASRYVEDFPFDSNKIKQIVTPQDEDVTRREFLGGAFLEEVSLL